MLEESRRTMITKANTKSRWPSTSAVLEMNPNSATPVSENEFTVQQIVGLTGLSEHTLRYYERLGLVAPVRREHSSGHRRYTQADLYRLETLACLRATGMPLAEMRQYFEALAEGDEGIPRQKILLINHKAALRERLRQTRRNLEYLDFKIAYWDAVEAGDHQEATAITAYYQNWLRSDAQPASAPAEHDPSLKRNDKENL